MDRVIPACLIITLLFCGIAQAQTASQARVTFAESFGVSPVRIEGRYPIITFIPRTFLLFDVDYSEPDDILGSQYMAATTQDGVRVYVLESIVSPGTFATVYGDQEIIFNQQYTVCLFSNCDRSNDDNLLRINAGDVFDEVEVPGNDGSVVELIGNRGDRENESFVTGYISRNELERLNRISIVTRASLRHPRYIIEQESSDVLNTVCGEVKEVGEYLRNLPGKDVRIVEIAGLGEVNSENELRLSFEHGEIDKEIEYNIYEVTDQRVDPPVTTTYVSQIKYACDGSNPIAREREYIESVVFWNGATGASEIFSPEGTPPDLKRYTGVPYLYSVNNSQHYFDLMDRLSDKIETRALAGYFISAFNRSCRGEDRKNTSCQHAAYSD